MRDVVVCEPLRTPIGRYGGALKGISAAELGATVLRALLERTRIDPALVDEVILGHCYGSSEAPALGRVVALDAGLPDGVGGQHVDRRCGSGLQAILNAVMSVQTGAHDLVVAGGAESMSNAVFYSTDMRWGGARSGVQIHDALVRGRTTAGGRLHPVPGGMLETAENLRRDYKISRQEQDELAVESHRRASAAASSGVFDDELVPVPVATRSGIELVTADEHPRADTTLDSLARLPPLLGAVDPEATVTAGNASGQNDAAALCVVTTRDLAERHGLKPLVRLVSWGLAGVPPRTMGIGPVPATAKALERVGLGLADMDLIELNEAFASQALAVMQDWGLGASDRERINVHGSGISLGHPVGATGARMLGVLARELNRRQLRYGLETMCIGGGQGLAAVWERVAD
jgi:acetyl-CoA C-acetyltransferase